MNDYRYVTFQSAFYRITQQNTLELNNDNGSQGQLLIHTQTPTVITNPRRN